MMEIDIVVTTRNRLSYLKKTLQFIYERTRYPHRLHVIDDNSDEGNVDFLLEEWKAGRIQHLLLRGGHVGAMGNLNAGAWMSFSDPMVFTDDDVLCPDINPDWLERGVLEMKRRPKLALLALHHPGAKHKVIKFDGDVTYCKSVGGTFLFTRRQYLMENPLPHEFGKLQEPLAPRCKAARENGWDVGFLMEVFCYHIGEHSVLTGESYKGRFIQPKDWKTLEPTRRMYGG